MKNKSEVLLTVFMTTYNRDSFIMQAIDAILGQTFTNFKLVILDNASTDDTEKIVTSIDDPRLEYIKTETNIGAVKNSSRAFDLADTKYFSLTHDDDIMLPNMLEKQIEFMEEHNEITLCGVSTILINQDTSEDMIMEYAKKSRNSGELKGIVYKKRELYFNFMLGKAYIPCPTAMYRTSFIKTHGILPNENAGLINDQFLFCNINLCGGDVFLAHNKLYLYRIHRLQDSKNLVSDYDSKFTDAFYELLNASGDTEAIEYLGYFIQNVLKTWAGRYALRKITKERYKSIEFDIKSKPYYNGLKFSSRLTIVIAKYFPFVIRGAHKIVRGKSKE